MRLSEIRIAARKSDLARLQAYLVGDALRSKFPSLNVVYQFRESLGDKNLNDPLWKMPEKGVFTEDFYRDLLDGKTDLVVHSWKDLPVESKPQTTIAATLARADVRDLLLFKKTSLRKLQERTALRIFSSSPRRSYNLIPFLNEYLPYQNQHVDFEPVRGNVQTRVRKMLDNLDIDGLIVAKAAMDRLLSASQNEFQETRNFLRSAMDQCVWMVLPLSQNPSAAAQGALAIECLESRSDFIEMLSVINDGDTFDSVQSERQRLAQFGGGCHQKIGVTHLIRPFGKIEFLRGLTDQGQALDTQQSLGLSVPHGLRIVGSDHHFRKEKVPVVLPSQVNAYFVSHSEAWQSTFSQPEVLWTAGLKTWKDLAHLGLWVNGSAESLGEQESLRLESLAPGLRWAKLGHENATQSGGKQLIATYRLVPQEHSVSKQLQGENFYWKSASSFRSALEKQPDLVEKNHYCGPGNSFEEIRQFYANIKVLWPKPN